jgi:hypothetical protein
MTLDELNESLSQRIDEIEGKLVFDNENKLKTIYGRLKSESLDEYTTAQRYRREGDEYEEGVHVGECVGLRRAADLLEEYYPWLKKDEEDD